MDKEVDVTRLVVLLQTMSRVRQARRRNAELVWRTPNIEYDMKWVSSM